MAAGIDATLSRLETVVQGCDSSAEWRRSLQRLSTLEDAEALGAGLDLRYWLTLTPHEEVPIVSGALVTLKAKAELELARYFGGGSLMGRDFHALHKALQIQADTVQQSLEHPSNWDTANTGLVLCTLARSRLAKPAAPDLLLWVIELDVMIRYARPATVVA